MKAPVDMVLLGILVKIANKELGKRKKPQRHKPISVSELPLIDKATKWGITVKLANQRFKCHGHYDKEQKEIHLVFINPKNYLHALTHAAIEKKCGIITHNHFEWKEIISELAALTILEILSNQPAESLRASYSFIVSNSAALKKDPFYACLDVFGDTEDIVTFILI